MKKVSVWLGIVSSFVCSLTLPVVAIADTTAVGVVSGAHNNTALYMSTVQFFISDTLIPFLVSMGVLVFVYGMFRYFVMGGSDEESKEKGKDLMVWAVVGFVALLLIVGIIQIIVGGSALSGAGVKTPKTDTSTISPGA